MKGIQVSLLVLHLLSLVLSLSLTFIEQDSVAGRKTQLLTDLESFQSGFDSYLVQARQKVERWFQEPTVQSFKRSKLRKKFAFERKSDFQDHAIRVSIYEIRQKSMKWEARPVFETFKPGMVFDRITEALMNHALEFTGEGSGKSDGALSKFSEMASILMPGKGIQSFTTPGEFVPLQFMGEDTLFYWNVITKRCPQRVRKSKGITKCVRGLFVAEIERRLLLRDYWESLPKSQEEKPFVVFLEQKSDLKFVHSILPTDHFDNQAVAETVESTMKDGFPSLLVEPEAQVGVFPSPQVRQVLMGVYREGFSTLSIKAVLQGALISAVLFLALFLFTGGFCSRSQ